MKNLKSKLAIILIALVLGGLGVFQYHWFSRAAEIEREGVFRTLAGTVFQTTVRESQRYQILLEKIKSILPETSGTEVLDKELNSIESSFGAPGIRGSLIKKAYRVTADSPIPGKLPLPKDVDQSLNSYEIFLFTPESASPGESYFLARTSGGQTLVFTLDPQGFFETFVRPALEVAMPGYELNLQAPRGDSLELRPEAFQLGNYRFNPLAALLGLSQDGPREFVFPFQVFVERFRYSKDTKAIPPAPGDTRGHFKPVGKESSQREASRDNSGALQLRIRGSSAFEPVEKRLAMDWLLSLTLIIILGGAFVLTLFQIQRSRELRTKEREFVAAITHELRTPLTVIQTAGENLASGIVNADKAAKYGQTLVDQSQRLGRMIEEVLTFSQVEGSLGTKASRDIVDLADLTKRLQEALDPLARARSLTLHWDLGSMPETWLGDGKALSLSLSNLISNALTHSYSGDVTGEVRVLGRLSLGKWLQFTVEDDGRGIHPKEARKVFQAFYRDKVSRQSHIRGSGLGLFLAQKKIGALGGRIVLESPYRRIDGIKRSGCRFILEVPYSQEKNHG